MVVSILDSIFLRNLRKFVGSSKVSKDQSFHWDGMGRLFEMWRKIVDDAMTNLIKYSAYTVSLIFINKRNAAKHSANFCKPLTFVNYAASLNFVISKENKLLFYSWMEDAIFKSNSLPLSSVILKYNSLPSLLLSPRKRTLMLSRYRQKVMEFQITRTFQLFLR